MAAYWVLALEATSEANPRLSTQIAWLCRCSLVLRCPPGHLTKMRSPGTIGAGWGRVSRIMLGRKLAGIWVRAVCLEERLRITVLTQPHVVQPKGTDR